MTEPIILFDGVCNLCNASVQFVIRHDPQARFKFAALQSATAEKLLQNCAFDRASLDSVILVEDGHVYIESDAALRIARKLGGGWWLLAGFSIVPRPIRDAVYRFIARNRYRWFGKQESCMMPTPDLRARFLA